MLDLASQVATHEKSEARRRELDGREREHGGLVPADRQAEEQRRSVKGWGPYRPDTTVAEVNATRRGLLCDLERVTLQRLWVDCGAAVRRFAPAWKRERAETLRDDALLLLIRWPSHGGGQRTDGTRAATLDLGGNGGTPSRADWLERVETGGRVPRFTLTAAAWHALRAAVKQASRAPSERAQDETEAAEIPTEAPDIARMVEEEQRETGAATRLPDGAAPDVIAESLGVTLDAGRAIVAKAYPAASVRALAETWGISEQGAKNALSRGAARVREVFPDPLDLLDALSEAGAKWRARTEADAILTLIDYRDGMAAEGAALDAVRDWRGARDGLPAQTQALLGAARAAMRRHGHEYGSERAELIAASVPRLLRAEKQRGARMAALGARGSHLPGRSNDPSGDTVNAERRPRELRAIVRLDAERRPCVCLVTR